MGWEFETEHSTGFEGEVNFVIWSQSTLSLQILSWLQGIEKGNTPNYFYVSSENSRQST